MCNETLHNTSVLVECGGGSSCFSSGLADAVSVFEHGVPLVKRVIIRFICVYFVPRFEF